MARKTNVLSTVQSTGSQSPISTYFITYLETCDFILYYVYIYKYLIIIIYTYEMFVCVCPPPPCRGAEAPQTGLKALKQG